MRSRALGRLNVSGSAKPGPRRVEVGRDKRERAEQQAAERAWKWRQSAGKLADRFPNIDSITFGFSFGVEDISGRAPDSQHHVRKPDHSGSFEFDCRSTALAGDSTSMTWCRKRWGTEKRYGKEDSSAAACSAPEVRINA